MSHLIPSKVFLTKGVGVHKEKLASFELALRRAGIADQNLVMVSSIFPPHCALVPREKGIRKLKPGQITFCVMSRNETNEAYRLISSSIGVAIPRDKSKYGYLSEHHDAGKVERVVSNYAEDLAAEMLTTTMGKDVDESLDWDSKKKIWKLDKDIFKTTAITQSSFGKKGVWVSVLSAAVFLFDE